MAEEQDIQTTAAPSRRRTNPHMVMGTFVWSMLKPFILVVGGAIALLALLRLSGV